MARRSRVEGPNQLRRKLRRIDPEITKSLRDALARAASAIEAAATQLVPVDTGDLAGSIEHKISADGLTAVIGPGARAAEIIRSKTGSQFGRFAKAGKRKGQKVNMRGANKKLLMMFYRGYWVEFGTKGSAKHNIPPQSPRPFMRPAFDINKGRAKSEIAARINQVLKTVSAGGSYGRTG